MIATAVLITILVIASALAVRSVLKRRNHCASCPLRGGCGKCSH